MYLLDTDVLSGTLRPHVSTKLLRHIDAVPPALQYTSSASVGELLYGVYKRSAPDDDLLTRIDQNIIRNFTVIPFDEDAARQYGPLRAELERRGEQIGEADTRIAAIALARGLTVVTGNVRHFARVPELVVEDWLG